MSQGRRVRPIQSRGDVTKFRYIDDRPEGRPSTVWASCKPNYKSPFRNDPFVARGNGALFLSNSDLALLGLAGLAIAPLALAWSGVASAYFITGPGGLLYSSLSVGQGILGAPTVAALAGFIKPQSAQFTNFNKPCSEQAGGAF